jgi:hypothetical protein
MNVFIITATWIEDGDVYIDSVFANKDNAKAHLESLPKDKDISYKLVGIKISDMQGGLL